MTELISEKKGGETTSPRTIESQSTRIDLAKQDQKTLIQAISGIIANGRQIVIPIGFPAAGKSLFLSSLMYYAQNYPGKKWQGNALNEGVFKQGNISRNMMIEYFNMQEAYPSTNDGTLDLIGIDIEPDDKNLPVLPLAFIDLSGEDIRQIKVDEKGEFGRQIEGILKACTDATPVFCMLTPYKPIKGNDNIENQMHKNFLDYLRESLPDLYANSKFIFIVSQWDKKPKMEDLDVETFIEQKRPALHNAKKGRKKSDICYGEFSVGTLMDSYKMEKDADGKDIEKSVVLIQRIDTEYPGKFWENLYQLITGKPLLPGGCLAKFFPF